MWAAVRVCVVWLPFVSGLTEHMCCYCERLCAAALCLCVYMKGSNCVSWGPPGSTVQILGPEQLAWGLVRGRLERDAGGLTLPLSHQTWAVGGRWTGHSHCQRARGATGPRERASQD